MVRRKGQLKGVYADIPLKFPTSRENFGALVNINIAVDWDRSGLPIGQCHQRDF